MAGARRLALELLEERRPLSAQPIELTPTAHAHEDLAICELLHESQWLGEGSESQADVPAGVPPFPLGDTFKLHSNPGATKVIYLDFNGHVTTNTLWNDLWDLDTIDTPSYSIDGNRAAFSNSELERIQIIWERTVEDFLPFDVDVTTEDPGVDALRKLGANDTKWGIRVVIGPDQADTGAGGIAYIGSFTWDTDTPTFVFNEGLVGIAEAVSHEVGHTLGLRHDGQSGGVEYYQGHGTGPTSWAPIMGVGYYVELVQWSKGTYPRANRSEDDLSIITTDNGFGYRTDDHSNSNASATSLATGLTLAGQGIIERNTDVDYFVFNAGVGSTTIEVAPFYRSPNLDILATLYDATGVVVAMSNPVAALNASITVVLTAGTYYLAIDGAGKPANGADYGYSDYGSLGYYKITGTRADPDQAGIHGVKWNDRNGDGSQDADEPGLAGWTIFADANGNGQLNAGEKSAVTGADGAYSITGLEAGVYVVAEVQKPGWKQTFPTAPGTYSVTLAKGEQSFDNNFGNQAGSIRGQKWFDKNANGVKEEGERRLEGWTIFLDDNADGDLDEGEASTTTDADGNYAFLDLVPKTYTVAEVLRGNWAQVYPGATGSHSVALTLAQQVTDIDFGNSVGSIDGIVWNDLDGDGLVEEGENPLEGWTVYRDANRNGLFDAGPSTFASTNVPQTLSDLATIVSQITVANLTSITDLDVTLNIQHSYASDLDVFLISPSGKRVELFTDVGSNGDNFVNTILDDEAVTGIAAGVVPFTGRYRPEALLSQFDGENPNGIWKLEITDDHNADGGALLGWSLTISATEQFAVTDANGAYEFLELTAGEHSIGHVTKPNWARTYPTPSATHLVTLGPGQSLSNINFGDRLALISGQKWNDADGDGAKDESETGLSGWVVYLDFNSNGQLDAGSQTTPASGLPKAVPDLGKVTSTLVVSGLRSIDDVNVTLSIDHTFLADLDVTLISPSGRRVELFSDVGGNQNLVNTTLDDDASVSIIATPAFVGSFKPEGLLADFNGDNPNGLWTLEVIDDGGNDVGTLKSWSLTISSHEESAVTDATGNYAFPDLTPGSYVVREVPKAGWNATSPVNPARHLLALAAGQQAAGLNFGSKAAILFGDYNRDGYVNGGDFLMWQRTLGTTNLAPTAGADGNGNSKVDSPDLHVWTGQYANVAQPAASAAVVALEPESPTDAIDSAFAGLDAAALAGPRAYSAPLRTTATLARPRFRPTSLPAASRIAAAVASTAPAPAERFALTNDDLKESAGAPDVAGADTFGSELL